MTEIVDRNGYPLQVTQRVRLKKGGQTRGVVTEVHSDGKVDVQEFTPGCGLRTRPAGELEVLRRATDKGKELFDHRESSYLETRRAAGRLVRPQKRRS